jgi:hypothetical protein
MIMTSASVPGVVDVNTDFATAVLVRAVVAITCNDNFKKSLLFMGLPIF